MAASDYIMNFAPIAGGLIGGPVGALAGAAIAGGVGMASADKLQKDADKAARAIPMYDPMQQALLGKVQQQQRYYRAGTDAFTTAAVQRAQNTGAQVRANIARSGMGSQSTVDALLRSQRATDQATGQAGAEAYNRATQLMGMEAGIVNDMASRRYDIQRWYRQKAMMEAAQRRQDANRILGSIVGMVPQVGLNGVLKGQPGQGSTPGQMTSDINSYVRGLGPLAAQEGGGQAISLAAPGQAGPIATPMPAGPTYGNMPTVPQPQLPFDSSFLFATPNPYVSAP